MLSHFHGAHEQRREKRTSAFTKLALKEKGLEVWKREY
jgi:hypothetical protein